MKKKEEKFMPTACELKKISDEAQEDLIECSMTFLIDALENVASQGQYTYLYFVGDQKLTKASIKKIRKRLKNLGYETMKQISFDGGPHVEYIFIAWF